MSSTPKKAPPTGAASTSASRKLPNASSTPTSSAAHNRSPSRVTAETGTAAAKSNAAGSLDRVRSVRNGAGTPLSARAAARKPASGDSVDDDAKAELQARLDELQQKLQATEQALEDSHKQGAVLQVRLDEALKEQGILEENVHEHAERIEELENDKKDSLRSRRELEQIYEAERVQAMKEKEESQAKEEELQNTMQRMKENLAQKEIRDRTPGLEDDRRASMNRTGSFRNNTQSPGTDPSAAGNGQFAPPSSVQRSDSRSSSRLVMQKDKIIESLRLELAEAQIKLVELDNQGGGRLHELEKEMYDIKMQNARLMEENESFQLLLSEKTLNGDLAQSELLRLPSHVGSRPPSRAPNQGTSLADELEGQQDETEVSEGADPVDRRLQAEVNSLKDQNKALTLYINNIISRLLQHEQFEQILDKTPDLMAGPSVISRKPAVPDDKELPPPPPPKDDEVAPTIGQEDGGLASGLLQRARSVMGAGQKKRPMSVYQPTSNPLFTDHAPEARVNENPDTAPRIPLGRANSVRNPSAHRRSNSEWSAASVVTNMYRGPSPSLQGPASPGLASPTLTNRNSFFGASQVLSAGQRVPSGNAVPTISETKKENSQQRDSKTISPPLMASSSFQNPHSDGVTSYPADLDSLDAAGISTAPLSNPSSPPRSTTSSGDRDNRGGGAIMMGSKPRPLRLVQETHDDDKARKAANRSSWFGWMNKGGPTPGGGVGRAPSTGDGGPGQ